MMLSAHILTGAALATIMPASPSGKISAFVVGMISHYALDSLPHWERLFKPHYNDQLPTDYSSWPKSIFVQGAVDTFLGLLLLGCFVSVAPPANALCIFLGGLGAALPDIVDSAPWWKHLTKTLPLWKIASRLHDKVHMSYKKQRQLPYFTGLVTQLIAVSMALFVLLGFKT